MSKGKKIKIVDSQIGFVGDDAHIEGGIHFHGQPATKKLEEQPSHEPGIEFLIITALEEEQDAVLSKLPGYSRVPPSHDDVRLYYQAEIPIDFPGTDASYRVIVTCLLGMGHVEATTTTVDAIRMWRPRYVLLVGIAGGIAKADVNLGDILIADQVVDYELQKLKPEGPQYRWRAFPVDPRLRGAALNYKPAECLTLLSVTRPETGVPQRHMGPVATGNKVVADEKVLNELLSFY